MNLFDSISVSAAHQRAVQIKKQLGQRSGGGLLTGVGSSIGGVSRATGGSGPGQRTSSSGPVQHAPPTITLENRASTSGIKCFDCG